MAGLDSIALKKNERLLLMYFCYTAFHGMLRKWVFSGNSGVNNVLFLIQLLMPFIVFWAMKREKSFFSYQPLFAYAVVLIGCALNPMNHTIFHGISGFLLHFGFWLIMLTYVNEREAFPIERLMGAFLIICFAEVILSVVQFSLPTTHFLNRYESSDEVVGFNNGVGVRVIGTFSYIAGYGSFLFFIGLFVWALMIENKRNTVVILSLAGFGLVSTFMNGSRSIMLPYVVCVGFGFVSYGTFGQKMKAGITLALLVGLGLAFNIGKKASFIETSYNAFAQRVEYGQKSGEAAERTAGAFLDVSEFRGKYPLFGIGLGATYQGATSKWGRSHELIEYGYCEEEPARILLEGGYFLFIIRVLLFGLLIWQLKIPAMFSTPILFYVYFFTLFVFNTYQCTFVFFGMALLDKLYYLNAKGRMNNEELGVYGRIK